MRRTLEYESYGARLQVGSSDEGLLLAADERVRSCLLGRLKPASAGPFDIVIDLSREQGTFTMDRNGAYLSSGDNEHTFFKFFDAIVRISVAEYARGLVFLHAGVVGWRGKGLILPAQSFRGKSTLVMELVRAGAEYYSDDFAILDRKGFVRPFPRPISMRTRDGKFDTYELDANELGIVADDHPLPVGMIFLTEHRPKARWRPQVLTTGEAILETIPFALPLQRDPQLCLKVLNRVAANAIIAKSPRGEARRTARLLLDFFDRTLK